MVKCCRRGRGQGGGGKGRREGGGGRGRGRREGGGASLLSLLFFFITVSQPTTEVPTGMLFCAVASNCFSWLSAVGGEGGRGEGGRGGGRGEGEEGGGRGRREGGGASLLSLLFFFITVSQPTTEVPTGMLFCAVASNCFSWLSVVGGEGGRGEGGRGGGRGGRGRREGGRGRREGEGLVCFHYFFSSSQ